MYCDELSLTLLNAVQVLQAARKYQINGLTQRCLEFVANNLTDNDVCSLLERAVSISEQPLIDVCLRHIECHTAAVFQSPSFLAVSQTALTHIVSLQTIDVSELDLFHACVAWAEHRATISSPTKVALNGKVLRRSRAKFSGAASTADSFSDDDDGRIRNICRAAEHSDGHGDLQCL